MESIKERLIKAIARRELYEKAEAAILSGQSYEAEGLKLTRANLKDVATILASIKKEISMLENKRDKRKKFRVVRPGW